MSREETHVDHFETLAVQAHAAKLGMWVFLASEVLLFGALFTLYAASRVEHPGAFHEGIRHTSRVLGTVNTLVLLTSSFSVAAAVHALRERRRGLAFVLLSVSLLLALAFLVFKGVEWSEHIREGIVPGGGTAFFQAHPASGLPLFFTLYYVMTGLHALHVIVGSAVLAWCALRLRTLEPHVLEVSGLYWHLVDIVWIFLWPIFYLTGG
jgi:cytochrome c oxidase subunit 3